MNEKHIDCESENKQTIQTKESPPDNDDTSRIYYVDGKFVSADKAVIPVDDLAVLRGVGVCDLMRTYKGKPFFLKEHVERLIQSAREVNLGINWSCDDIEKIILETLNRNSAIDEANIRVIITGGSSSDFINPSGNPRLIVLIAAIPPIPGHWYDKGVKVITVPFQRDVPKAKSLSYIPATLALKKARAVNAVEALYVNPKGFVTEGTTSNLFAFINDNLITAEEDILKGITRKVILALSEKRFTIELRDLHMDELVRADEVFISGTNKGVVPVVQIDNIVIGDGNPGENTKRIMDALDKQTKS